MSGTLLRATLVAALGSAVPAGCAPPMHSPAIASPTASAQASIAIETDDQRLRPPLLEIATNPGWRPGHTSSLRAGAPVASIDEVCVAVQRPGEPQLSVALDVSDVPWTVLGVMVLPGHEDAEPETTYERAGYANTELCLHVLAGPHATFPAAATAIAVNGPVPQPGHVAVIRQGLMDAPERFGIDRTGLPSINFLDRTSPNDPSLTCYGGVVYQGGPRSQVMVGVRDVAGLARLDTVRIVRQALRPAQPPINGSC